MTLPGTEPAGITSLGTILVATAAYTGDADSVFYNEAPQATTGLHAVLFQDGDVYGIMLYSDVAGALATLEQMAKELQSKLPTNKRADMTGLWIGSVDIGESDDPQDDQQAGEGKAVPSIPLTLNTRKEG